MSLFYIAKKLGSFKKTVSSTGLIRFLKGLFFSYHEEILLMKDLNKLESFSFGNRLEVINIKREYISSLRYLRNEPGIINSDIKNELREYFNNNCNGLIAKLKEEIIGYIWWGNNTMKCSFEDSSKDIVFKFYLDRIKLKELDIYGFDFFLIPKYRCRGYSIEFLSNFLSLLKNLAYEKTFGYVLSDNLPARWTYRLLGYEEIEKIKIRRFFLFLVFRNKKMYFDRNWRAAIWEIK